MWEKNVKKVWIENGYIKKDNEKIDKEKEIKIVDMKIIEKRKVIIGNKKVSDRIVGKGGKEM